MTPCMVKTACHMNTPIARVTCFSQRVCANAMMGTRVIQAFAHLAFWWWREDLNVTTFWWRVLCTRWWRFPKEQEGAGCFANKPAPVFLAPHTNFFWAICMYLVFYTALWKYKPRSSCETWQTMYQLMTQIFQYLHMGTKGVLIEKLDPPKTWPVYVVHT